MKQRPGEKPKGMCWKEPRTPLHEHKDVSYVRCFCVSMKTAQQCGKD